MTEHDLMGVMNNTKWNELRLAMCGLDKHHPKWRTKDRDTGNICPWDGEWYYHFRGLGYEAIEWVEMRIDSIQQREAVRACLREIHVPGVETDDGFRVYGWIPPGEPISYIE